MKDLKTFLNRELSTAGISGYAYVACREKGGGQLSKIIIASARRCGHVNRICVDCAGEWRDYVILWENTAGGRKLKAELDQRNNSPVS